MDTEASYWRGLTRERLTRRSLLRSGAAASFGLAALSLAGCGGGGSSPSGGSGLVSSPVDSSAEATRGGILPSISTSDTPGFTAYPSVSSFVTGHNERVYSKLVQSTLANVAKGEQAVSTVDPDITSGYEFSPDGLTLTMRLRPNAGFDPRPPTNGRNATVDDINYTWNQYKASHKSRGQLAYEVNKNAPIEALTTPDSSTIVLRLAFPSPSLLPNLAYSLNAPYIYPVEADGKFDAAKDMRGSCPWMLDTYVPSNMFQYRRNPNWYRKERPFLDGVDMPIVPEYSSQLAQFRTGRVYSFPVQSDDIIQTKQDIPDLVMQSNDFSPSVQELIWFDFRKDKGSIWFDDRVRQALSLTIDRELFISTVNNVDAFAPEGIPMEKKWNSHIGVGEAEFWLDPQSKDFGPTPSTS